MTQATNTQKKIAAKSILLERPGSGATHTLRLELKRFTPAHDIWAQANDALRLWAQDAPSDDQYHRVEFLILYTDGSSFKSIILLQQPHAINPEQAPDVGALSRSCIEVFAGLRRPQHFTTEDYQLFLHTFGRASRERYAQLLAHYELPGAHEEVADNDSITNAPIIQPSEDYTDNRPPA